jgi:hypothetical protein
MMPEIRNPFFIVAPAYRRGSAGVTVLYLLCHYLNRAGESAYIVRYLPEPVPDDRLPDGVFLQVQNEFPAGMLAPPITQEVLTFYDQRRLTPIVIYPEIFDNPLNAGFFGRYILNYPGKLAQSYVEDSHFDIAYSRVLADHCATATRVPDVLFMPTCDLEFWSGNPEAERGGACHYAARLRAAGALDPATLPAGSIEILPSDQMTRLEIREIFRRSEAFYCFEDTALAIEAQLCGCPTVFVQNEIFSATIMTVAELGTDGYCFAGDAAGFARAKATVGSLRPILEGHIAGAPGRIAGLAAKWRALALQQEYRGTITYPFEPRLVLFGKLEPPADPGAR